MTKERREQFLLVTLTLEKLTRAPIMAAEVKAILPLMRQEMVEAGVNLELSEKGRESLGKRQFRGLESGRGPGVVEALGRERAVDLLNWCRAHGQRKIGNKEGTEGWGLQQTAADMIYILATESPTEEQIQSFTLKMNQRVKKGLGKKAGVGWEQIPKIEPEEKWRQMASVPPGTVAGLWERITNKPGTEEESVL